jgi:hypothetical protein
MQTVNQAALGLLYANSKTFLGMEVGQNDIEIKLHLDYYMQTVPNKVPISPGVVLHPDKFRQS